MIQKGLKKPANADPSGRLADPEECPFNHAMEIISGKWKPQILHLIRSGHNRFGLLINTVPGISKQVLTKQLRDLENRGVISRTVFAQVPLKVEYSITPFGESLFPVLEVIHRWSEGINNSTLA